MKNFELPIKIEAIPFVLINGECKILLIKRVPEDGGFWQPVTGTLESNESLECCIYRELSEEVSIESEDIKNITEMFYEFSWEKRSKVIYEYVFGVELKKNERSGIKQ